MAHILLMGSQRRSDVPNRPSQYIWACRGRSSQYCLTSHTSGPNSEELLCVCFHQNMAEWQHSLLIKLPSITTTQTLRSTQTPLPVPTTRPCACLMPAQRGHAPPTTHVKNVFTDIFNTFLEQAIVPSCFKTATIIPVPKKSSPTCFKDYRPVALTPIIIKCFKWLVITHKIHSHPSPWTPTSLHTRFLLPQPPELQSAWSACTCQLHQESHEPTELGRTPFGHSFRQPC